MQRVRGSDEEKIREELVEMLTDCGVGIDTNTLENIAVTVPKMQTVVRDIMKNPLTLKLQGKQGQRVLLRKEISTVSTSVAKNH